MEFLAILAIAALLLIAVALYLLRTPKESPKAKPGWLRGPHDPDGPWY